MKSTRIILSFITSLSLMLPTSLAFADTQSEEGTEDYEPELTIPVTMSTEGGQWKDASGDNHNNGTFLLTVPKKITLENAAIGEVNIEEEYTVNVQGAITSDNKVQVSATPSSLANGTSELSMTVEQEKESWNSTECIGTITDDKLSGTDSTDTLKINGIVDTLGEYSGTVTYTAELKESYRVMLDLNYSNNGNIDSYSYIYNSVDNNDLLYNPELTWDSEEIDGYVESLAHNSLPLDTITYMDISHLHNSKDMFNDIRMPVVLQWSVPTWFIIQDSATKEILAVCTPENKDTFSYNVDRSVNIKVQIETCDERGQDSDGIWTPAPTVG